MATVRGRRQNRGDRGLFLLGSQVPTDTNLNRKKSPVEPYAPIPGAGPFAASVNLFTALVAELEGPGAAGLTACELEDLLAERGREVQRQLLQDHLDLRAVREERAAREHHAPVVGADGITRNRVEAGHGRLLARLFGTVRVTRCAWRRPGVPSLYPADAALSLPACRPSHTLARLAAVEAARGSFEAAHAANWRLKAPVRRPDTPRPRWRRHGEDELIRTPVPETMRAFGWNAGQAVRLDRVAANSSDPTPADTGRPLVDQGSVKAGLTASISPPCAVGNRSGTRRRQPQQPGHLEQR